MRNTVWTFCLLLVAQVLICNYLHISKYLTLSILPVMVLCIPTKVSTLKALFMAFAAGFAVDFAAEGVLGLNVMALLPVAALRSTVCRLVFGEELIAREDDFSVHKYGIAKVAFAAALVQAVFLALYIWADGGTARTFEFNLTRGLVSLAAGLAVSVPIADMLTKEDR